MTDTLPALPVSTGSIYNSMTAFQDGQRIAQALASSSLVPQDYRGNVANTLVALEMAQRTGSSPMAVMQNMHVIHGRPSWSSQFVIAALNSCGRFGPLRFRVTGEGDQKTCVAHAIDKTTGGEVLEGPPVSIAMAKAEGWFSKSGSKWQTMPELMLRYRAAKFFGNLYASDILMGMHTPEEIEDFADIPAPAAPATGRTFVQAPQPDLDVSDVIVHTARPPVAEPAAVEPPPVAETRAPRGRKPAAAASPAPVEPAPDLPPTPPADSDDWGFGA